MKRIHFYFPVLIGFLMLLQPVAAQTSNEACTGKNSALETLGAASGMMIYNTYIAIGAIADGSDKGVYDDTKVIELMEEQISAMNTLDTQFTQLNKSGFITDPSDKQYIVDLITTIRYLKDEAYYLKRYKSSGLQSDLNEYNSSRESAWELIKELLGIVEE